MTKSAMGLVLLTCAFLAACGDEEDAANSLEIEGSWESNFMSTEVISDDSWAVDYGDGPASSEIVEFSNDDNSAVLLGSDGKYGRTVWSDIANDSFYYCGVSFGQASVQDAIDESEPYDDSDPSTGCGTSDFPWTILTRK